MQEKSSRVTYVLQNYLD